MESWVRYTLDTFKNVYGLSTPLPVYYGRQAEEGVHINDAGRTFFEKNQKIDSASITWKSWEDTELPILFDPSPGSPIIQRQSDRIFISCDLLASSFYFLSGWHEFQQVKEKEFDRYPYQDSLIYELDIVRVPVVNYYFEILATALEQHTGRSYAAGRSSLGTIGIALTHDIDSLYTGWLEDGYAALKQGKPWSALKIGANRLRGQDTRFNLREIADYENQWDIKASYYFLTRYGNFNQLSHADYQIHDPRVRRLISMLMKSGHEIGIHGSKGAHLDSNLLSEEIHKVGASVTGGRYHYLNFDIRKTPRILEQSGLIYDSTLGFAEEIGFRNGIAHPFYLFDLSRMKPTSVLEIPLIIMDATLRQQNYMGVSASLAFEEIRPVLENVQKFRGAVSLLWHNGYFTDFKYAGWKQVLTEIISYCSERGTICTGKNVAELYSD